MTPTPRFTDRYAVLGQLGAGGSGHVWLVEDRHRPGSRLALKELARADPARAADLRQEFSTLKQLRHPNLVEVYELDTAPERGLPFFTLERIEGREIVAAVREEGPGLLPGLAAEALRSLAFLHDFQLLHRDLKPGNLYVRRRSRLGCRLVVLDFGLAMRGEPQSAAGQPAVGTLPYMAPELFRGVAASTRSDLYSIGVVLFEAVHGRTPLRLEGSVARFIEAALEGRRARPTLPDGYPAGLADWLDDLLTPDPAQRPATASEALARLNAACGSDFPVETSASRAARLASGPPPGRQAQIAALWEALVPAEEPRLVWLAGAPGSGKERLLRWLAGEAVGRAWDVVDSPPGLGAHGGQRRGNVDELLRELRARAARGPTLVLLSGVDGAGSRVAEFLERVAREGKQAPLHVVASIDPHSVTAPALRKLLAETGRVPTLRRIDLGPLGSAELADLVQRATPRQTVSPVKLRWLQQVSEGHPLVAEALLIDGAWEKGLRSEDLPRADHGVERRLGLLSVPARKLLEALAVVRIQLAPEIAASIGGLDAAAGREAAAELTAVGLIHTEPTGWSIESRALAQRVIDRLPATECAARHAAAARRIEEQPDLAATLVFDLARLWSVGGDRTRARLRAMQAAGDAEEQGDPVLAAERYAFALRHLPRRDPARLELRLRQAAMLRRANLSAAAARAFGAARFLARDAAQRAEIQARQAAMLVQAGRFARAEATGLAALAAARRTRNLAAAAAAMEAVGISLARQGRGRDSRRYLRRAVHAFGRVGDARALAHALQALGLAEINEGRPGAGEHLARALERFEALGASGEGLINRVGLAVLEQRAGRYDAARDLLEQTRSIAVERNNLLMQGLALCTMAQNDIFAGRYAEALALSRDSEEQARFLGDDRLLFASRSAQGQALVRCGQIVEGQALLAATLELSLERVDPVMQEYVRLALIEARLAGESADEPLRAALERSLAVTRRLRDPDTLLWSLVLELERRGREPNGTGPREILEELESLIAGGGSWDQPLYRARAALAAARWTARGDDAEGALAGARQAADLARGPGLHGLDAEALDLQCALLERLGRRAEAAEARRAGRRQLDLAAERISEADLCRGFVERPVFGHLREGGSPRQPADRRLLALYDMIRALNSESDTRALLESTLDMALTVVGAQRGMILLRDAGASGFHVAVARNLERETVEDAEAFSRHVIAEAESGKSVLAVDAKHDERFRDLKSVSLYGIHALMCVPLRSRGRMIGTVYLDNRSGKHLFTEQDVRFLEAFADHAALALENARDREWLEQENARLQAAAEARARFGNLIGQSPPMLEVFRLIGRLAASDLPALIQGESGTGKELVARAIHFNGPRRKRAFISENCAAIPDTLLQSELFGHVRGAYTGAERDRAGLFEQAHGGTLFLDEVGDMSPGMQAQLLRVLEEGKVRRVGGERAIEIDVRVLAATHRDLQQRVAAGLFREDLLYRLQVLMVSLPPLRERRSDIPLLTDYLLRRIALARSRATCFVEPPAMEVLQRYSWPGNVRQLENSVQRLSLLAGDGRITRDLLRQDPSLSQLLGGAAPRAEIPVLLVTSERERIRQALQAARGNRTRAAGLLGISRATIYRKIKEYDL